MYPQIHDKAIERLNKIGDAEYTSLQKNGLILFNKKECGGTKDERAAKIKREKLSSGSTVSDDDASKGLLDHGYYAQNNRWVGKIKISGKGFGFVTCKISRYLQQADGKFRLMSGEEKAQ